MPITEEPKVKADTGNEQPASGEARVDECADIKDPVRRSLCRVCGMPVLGAAPFCREHEPPVP